MLKLSELLPYLSDEKSQLAHAYIIESNDRLSAVEAAEQLSFWLLCTESYSGKQACGQCKSCQLFTAGNHADFIKLGQESGAIGVEEVRQASAALAKTPHIAKSQVVVIPNAQDMTESAANALLKTLEEPAGSSYLILLCDDKGKLLPTIRSRCQFLQLKELNRDELKQLFPNVPDYVLGFAKGAKSQIVAWQEEGVLSELEKIYQSFIAWLKGQKATFSLLQAVQGDELSESFLLYLIQRRVRQLMLKGVSHPEMAQKAEAAQTGLQKFYFAQQQIKGQNKNLALNKLFGQLEVLIR